jgi:hypothetical protein
MHFPRKKSFTILLLLFWYTNLHSFGGSSQRKLDWYRLQVETSHKVKLCNQKSSTIAERLKQKHSFLYLKIPELSNEYLEYGNEEAEQNLESYKRTEKSLPILIEFGDNILNPRKDDFMNYQVSSKIKERIISENSTITRRNCTFMALGSEYLFPIQSGRGTLSVILYFNYAQDIARYELLRSLGGTSQMIPESEFDNFIHRSLRTEINFEPGHIYQIEIKTNPNSAISRKSYTAWANAFDRMNTVPGFIITFKELPPNTKFAFDGKDDIGKDYMEVKKEFIFYETGVEKNIE